MHNVPYEWFDSMIILHGVARNNLLQVVPNKRIPVAVQPIPDEQERALQNIRTKSVVAAG